MKVYDKDIYNKQESIRMTIIIVVVFLLGFFAGYYSYSLLGSGKDANNNKIENSVVQINK